MKTVTIDLTKGEARATATIVYHDATWPASVTWTGDRRTMTLSDGSPLTLLASDDRLEEVVAHQASQAGATWIIRSTGTAAMRTDEVRG
jgi:ferric-dicitrate binding protein FerR (iron transport regulator)